MPRITTNRIDAATEMKAARLARGRMSYAQATARENYFRMLYLYQPIGTAAFRMVENMHITAITPRGTPATTAIFEAYLIDTTGRIHQYIYTKAANLQNRRDVAKVKNAKDSWYKMRTCKTLGELRISYLDPSLEQRGLFLE